MSSPKKTSQSLRVKDTLKRDARRGIARIDARLIEKLGIGICDLISTNAKRGTVARAGSKNRQTQFGI